MEVVLNGLPPTSSVWNDSASRSFSFLMKRDTIE